MLCWRILQIQYFYIQDFKKLIKPSFLKAPQKNEDCTKFDFCVFFLRIFKNAELKTKKVQMVLEPAKCNL